MERAKPRSGKVKKRPESSATVQSCGSYFDPANSVVADTSGLAHLAPSSKRLKERGFLDWGLGLALFFSTKSIFRSIEHVYNVHFSPLVFYSCPFSHALKLEKKPGQFLIYDLVIW